MGMFQGINVVSVPVPDLDEGRRFYRDVLGLGEPLYDLPDAGWIEFGTGERSGNLAITHVSSERRPGVPEETTVVLDVADCHEAHRELTERGVRCDEPVVFPGYVVFCSFYDPFGNRLQMCSPDRADQAKG
ncbi:VOC family protein [Nocardiopsis chromatogenes]|uniref:VOC family protein n=1 Tax=Nocardiopsis chromatogenes TaxID=280239 RepID=UPI0003762517|nr:VOC family protein [Nocardiopsis chromatogenes]